MSVGEAVQTDSFEGWRTSVRAGPASFTNVDGSEISFRYPYDFGDFTADLSRLEAMR